MRIFLQRRDDNLVNGTVVAEMHDLSTFTLQKTTDDIDRSIVAVEE
jgi:hypothetical protein